MNFKSCVKKVITQLRHLQAAEKKPKEDEAGGKRLKMAEGYTDNLQVRLEWARRKMADYVTEINTSLICFEEINQRIGKRLKFVRKIEEYVTVRSLLRKKRKLEPADAESVDDAYWPLYLASLYAFVASELETDILRARANKKHTSGTSDVIGRSDLMKPLLEGALLIACSYLHTAFKYSSQSEEHRVVFCQRSDVEYTRDDSMEVLRKIAQNIMVDGRLKIDLFAMPERPHKGLTVNGFSALIPPAFKAMVDNADELWRFTLPAKALFFTMTDEHLPPSFNLNLAVTNVLDLLSQRAHTSRHTARSHLCVLDHAEKLFNEKQSDSDLNHDLNQIMDMNSQNRLKIFYTECYMSLQKQAKYIEKRLSKRCGCQELLHITISTL